MEERSWAAIYNDLLTYQAELSHDLEQMFFRASPQWTQARSVLDFGSGNGYYAKLLSRIAPNKTFTCLEINEHLSRIAESNNENNNVQCVNGSFDSLGEGNAFDFVYCRHVLSYLNEDDQTNFIEWVGRNSSKTSAVLLIDADDQVFYTQPKLPILEGGNEKFKEELEEKGGNRALQNVISDKFHSIGYTHSYTRPLIVHSAISGRKYLMSMFMKSVAELDHGSPLSIESRDEIDSWSSSSDSYLQYGMFGSLFVKEG